MKKRIGLLVIGTSLSLSLGTLFGIKPNSPTNVNNGTNFASEGMVDENTYHETIYDEPGVNPVKMQLMDYNDYSQSPTNDGKYSTQKTYHLNSLNLGDTWDTYRGDGVTIAAIDTGINYSHEDFVYYGQTGTSISSLSACFEDPNGTGYATKKTVSSYGWDVMVDNNGHGTNVASTIASRINGKGCVGVAPNVNLIFCKAPNLMSSEVSAAIRYAADNGADIITMSIGMYDKSFTSPHTGKAVKYSTNAPDLFSSAINYAHDKGCLILASAGNDNTDNPSYPASNDYVIGVGALSKNSSTSKADYSNINKSTNTKSSNNNVDVTVCGSVYVATKATNVSYDSTQGTSFSCPITAAALALYCQSHPDWNEATARQALFDSCKDIGASGWDTTYGYGCVSISDLVGISYDVSQLNLSKTTLDLYSNNDSSVLTATVVPEYATNKTIDWTTSNSTVASISSTTSTSGNSITVTGKKAGTATITAKSRQFPSISKTCTVNVSSYVESSFTASIDETTMYAGNTQQIKVVWTNNVPTYNDLTYSSSNTSVATVSDTGMITALSAGSTTISIDSLDDSHTIQLTVLADKPASWKLIKSNSDLVAGGKYLFVGIKSDKTSYYCNGSLNSDYLNYVDITVQNETITNLPTTAEPLILGGSSGAWTFKFSSVDKYLNATSNSKFGSEDTATTYTISIADSGVATIKGGGGSYTVYSNASSPRFKPYSSSQSSVYLYKKVYEGDQPAATNYTVSFVANGGSGTMTNDTTNGSTYVTPSPTFTYDGYHFDKWALNSSSGTKYAVGSTISSISSNITLYATWIKNSSTSDGDFSGYYSTINENSSTLLADLRTLNLSKRTSTVGYSKMGTGTKTSPDDSPYMYTDYDPSTTRYNSKNQPYGTSILSFYSGISTTSWNKEHVWPASRLTGGRDDNVVDDDIYMARPTISSENSDRGNSVFYEGMTSSTAGWDPVEAFEKTLGVYPNIRGESARIIFYCMTVDSTLVLNELTSNSGNNMGRLSDLLKWNLENPVNDREVRRQSGGQYLQGNRNAFVDHPEYACKIWGNTNSTTRSICGLDGQKTLDSITVSGQKTSFTIGEEFSFGGTVTAHYSDNSTADVTSNATFSGYNLNTTGNQTVTVTYTENGIPKTTTYGITVSGSGSGGGDVTEPDTIVFDSNTNLSNFTIGSNATGSMSKGSNSNNAPVYYSNGDAVRCYGGNTFTISSAKTIVKIEITFSTGEGTNAISTDCGEYSNGTWTGSSNEVVFTIGGSSGHRRIHSIKVTYSGGETPPGPVPTITYDSLEYSGSPTKTTYVVGEQFDPTGLTVTAKYTGKEDQDVTSSVVWTPNPLTEGITSVTGTYTEGNTSHFVTVSGITVTSGQSSETSNATLNTINGSGTTFTDSLGVVWTLSGNYDHGNSYLSFKSGGKLTSTTININTSKDLIVNVKCGTYGGAGGQVKVYAIDSNGNKLTNEAIVTPESSGNVSYKATLAFTNKTTSQNVQIVMEAINVSNSKFVRLFGADYSYTPGVSIPKVTNVTLNQKELEFDLYINKTPYTLVADVTAETGADTSVTWSSSDNEVATVSNGIVTPVGVGTATITAKAGEKEATCSVKVTDSTPIAVTGVSLNESTLSLTVGGNETLVAIITPTNATNKNVTWSSSNSATATVDSNGKVTAVSAGTAVITVKTVDGNYTATCTVTVNAAPTIEYKLEADETTVSYMSGMNHSVSVGVKLYQYTNGVKGNQVSSGTSNVDTSVLGQQEISYTYQSVVYKTTVKVTNNGASGNVGLSTEGISKTDTINATMLNATTTSYVAFSNVSDKDGSEAVYAGSSANNSGNMQFKSKDSNTGIVQTTSGGKVISIKITIGSGTKTVDIYGKNSPYTSDGDLFDASKQGTKIGSTSSTTTINFDANNQYNYIGIRASDGAVYISKIEITCGAQGVSYPASPNDQAKAWADYFIRETRTLDTCLASTDAAKLAGLQSKWAELADEYEWMVSGAKDEFCTSTDSRIVEAREHYKYIVSKFGASNLGTDGNFVTNGQGTTLNTNAINRFSIVKLDNQTTLMVVISLISVASLGLYFYIKKRKEIE